MCAFCSKYIKCGLTSGEEEGEAGVVSERHQEAIESSRAVFLTVGL